MFDDGREIFDGEDWRIEFEGRYARMQLCGGDLVSIEEHGDGTAFLTVYTSNHRDGDVAWSGVVKLTDTP